MSTHGARTCAPVFQLIRGAALELGTWVTGRRPQQGNFATSMLILEDFHPIDNGFNTMPEIAIA